jgi:hypothetical protein
LLLGYLLLLLLLMWREESLIFVPMRHPQGQWTPYGLAVEDAWFEAADGVRLHGWYQPHAKPKAVVLFCHGNAGNVTHRQDRFRQLHDRVEASVLVFDYRGFGRSEGTPTEKGVLLDARAARAWLAKRENIAEGDVVVMGESLGSAVAVDLAAEDGARALVVESTFDSLPAVAAYHFPYAPVRWLMRTQLNSADKIARYRGPLLQAHGDSDSIVPLQFGQRLFAAANEPKEFILLEGHDHNDPMPDSYYDRVAAFLAGRQP